MKKIISLVLCLVVLATFVVPNFAMGAGKVIEHHLILPEDFSGNMGSWRLQELDGAFNGVTLFGLDWRDTSVTSPAVTTVTIEEAGEYTLWVHARELTNTPNQTGAWEFEVAVDGTKVGGTFGGGNREVTAFVWNEAGTVTLTAGDHEISLIDTYADWARCDALFLTNDADLVPSDDFETLQQQAASGGVVEDETEYVYVDNTDDGVSKSGPDANWVEYNDAAARGGSFYAATGAGSDIVSFTWPVALDTAGYWSVDVYVPAAAGDKEISTNVSYQISANGGIENVTVDQTAASGWVRLGVFGFAADGTENIKVAPEKNGTDWVLVDAIRLNYLGEYNPETTVIVDNEDAENVVLTGSFPGAGGAGWIGESTYRQGFVGENYYSMREGDSEATFAWKFKVPKAGYYDVSVNLAEAANGGVASQVNYEIYAANETVSVSISHNQPAGYFSLGKYYFEPTDNAVELIKLIGPVEGACMVDAAKIEFAGEDLETNKGYYQIDLNDPQQTILGLGVEIQSDSLGSGNTMDANDTSGHSVPHDLTLSERERFYSDLLGGFRYIRLAGGLFYRGTDAEGKHLTERWDTQDEELAEMIEKSGAEGFNLEFWSPTPYFKSNGEYHGGKLKCFDENWEYYGDEKKTNEFLTEFGQTIIEDISRMKEDGLPVVQFSLQNEPDLQSVYGTYSFCFYENDDYYKACCVLLPMLKEAFPELKIHVNSWNGQHSGAAWSIKGNPEVLACVDLWSYHTVGYNSDKMINEQSDYNYGTEGLPVFNAEFEYQPGDYTGQYDYRFVNTAQAIMNWMTFENSPTWYWLHALKPLGNEESIGYSLGMWRKSGDTTQYSFSSDEQSQYWNSLEEKTWAYNYPNYNALRGFLEFMPWDSVRYTVIEDETRLDQRIMAWKTPEGRLVFAVTNRDSSSPFEFSVDTGLDGATFKGYALTAYSEEMVELGESNGTTVDTTLDAYSVQFWVEQPAESATVEVVFTDNQGNTLATVEVAEGDVIDEATIPTAPSRYGYTFTDWSYDVEAPIMTDMVITALYEKDVEMQYNVTVSDDVQLTLPNDQTECYYNDRIKAVAARQKDGKNFSYWKVNGGIFSYSHEISFLAFGDVEMEAVYGELPGNPNKYVVFTDSNATVTDHKNGKYDMHIMGVVFGRSSEVSEIGIILGAGDYTAEEMIDGTATTVKLKASKATAGRQFVYTVKNIAYDQYRTAITYAVIDGVTYYSDISCVAVVETPKYGGDEIVDEEGQDPFN